MIQAFCDGSITGGAWGKANEKHTMPHAWCGWWVRFEEGHVIQWHSVDVGVAPYMSANVAEYMAVRSVLKWLSTTPWVGQVVEINSDSQVIINQLTGNNHTYDPKLILLRDHCLKLARLFPYVKYRWIRREQNREADVLSKALQIWGRQAQNWEEIEAYLRKKPSGKVKRSARWRAAQREPGSS